MSDDKVKEFIDKVNRGEIPMDSAELRTERTDEGGISSTFKVKCGPCNDNNHRECKGDLVCNCTHPYHKQQQSPQTGEQAHLVDAEKRGEPIITTATTTMTAADFYLTSKFSRM